MDFVKSFDIFGSVRSSGSHSVRVSVCLSVCLSGTKCSKALNLHLSLIGQSQLSLSQVSLRLVSGLSVPTSSDRLSLKYFVLLTIFSSSDLLVD